MRMTSSTPGGTPVGTPCSTPSLAATAPAVDAYFWDDVRPDVSAFRPWAIWASAQLGMQLQVVTPVSGFLLAFEYTALRKATSADAFTDLAERFAGLGAAAVGLTLFMFGLEAGVMPLGERVGVLLPERVSSATMYSLIFVIGAGCTIAEPSIAALQLAGSLVDPHASPFLWLLLTHPTWNALLVAAIALGVAFASVRTRGTRHPAQPSTADLAPSPNHARACCPVCRCLARCV